MWGAEVSGPSGKRGKGVTGPRPPPWSAGTQNAGRNRRGRLRTRALPPAYSPVPSAHWDPVCHDREGTTAPQREGRRGVQLKGSGRRTGLQIPRPTPVCHPDQEPRDLHSSRTQEASPPPGVRSTWLPSKRWSGKTPHRRVALERHLTGVSLRLRGCDSHTHCRAKNAGPGRGTAPGAARTHPVPTSASREDPRQGPQASAAPR